MIDIDRYIFWHCTYMSRENAAQATETKNQASGTSYSILLFPFFSHHHNMNERRFAARGHVVVCTYGVVDWKGLESFET